LKVLNIGTRKPYTAPPIILPTRPMNGHTISRIVTHKQSTIFKIGPNSFVLAFKECKEITTN